MHRAAVSCLAVVEDGRLLGILTDRDLRNRVLAAGLDPAGPVASVMTPDPPVVSPALAVRDLVDEYVLRRGLRAIPVAQDGRIVGLVSQTDVKHLPESEWSLNSVGAIMTRLPLRTIGPEAPVTRALELLVEQDVNQLVVVDKDGTLLGMLSRGDVMRFLQLRGELGMQR